MARHRGEERKGPSVRPGYGRLLLAAGLLLWAGAALASVPPLWLGLAPGGGAARTEGSKPPPGHHAQEAAGEAKGKGRRWPGAAGKAERFESEHRPLPVRTYFLPAPGRDATLTALLRKADGSLTTIDPVREGGTVKLGFAAAMGEGPMHGPNNLYAVESRVEGDTLLLRVAKWCTLHHNCGWGHDHKFDPERLTPKGCDQVPLEIVAHDLWDANFHSRLMSGDELRLDLLFRGRPATGATVRVTSEKGWSRELTADADGHATVQLIRDLYPASWSLFDRNQLGELRIEARYAVEEKGTLHGQEYRRIEMVTTFPWHYEPARREYTSLAYGLLVLTITMAVAGLGTYIHRERRRRPRREIVLDER